MPSLLPRVDFDPTPDYSRLPRDDEEYVIKAFAHHAAHCTSCADPYEVHKRGGSLCAKGHQRALDVAQYLYNKGGQAFSLVDRESNLRTRVEIPAGCDAVRGLLKAMERGLRLRRRAPAISYDETYYVPPRRVQTDLLEIVEPRTSADRRQQRRENPRYVGRGSLFEEDIRERERRRQSQQPVYYYTASRKLVVAPPTVSDWD